MTIPSNGRVPVDLKSLLTVGALVVGILTTWITLKSDVAAQSKAVTEHEQTIEQLKEEQQQDNVTQARLADRVEAIDEKVDKIDQKQAQMATEQTQMSRELFEQRTLLKTILEEVKKP